MAGGGKLRTLHPVFRAPGGASPLFKLPSKMTTRGKILVGALLVALLYFGINKLVSSGAVFKKADAASVLLTSIALPTATPTTWATRTRTSS